MTPEAEAALRRAGAAEVITALEKDVAMWRQRILWFPESERNAVDLCAQQVDYVIANVRRAMNEPLVSGTKSKKKARR
jgi:hypothetical protein